MSRRVPIERQIKEVVAALKAVGETILSVETTPEGGVIVLTVRGALAGSGARGGANEWDEVLPRQ